MKKRVSPNSKSKRYFLSNLLSIFYDFLESKFGFSFKKYSIPVILIFFAIFGLAVLFINNDFSVTSTVASIRKIFIGPKVIFNKPEILYESDFKDDEKWEFSNDITSIGNDPTYFGLVSTKKSGLLKFYKPIPEKSTIQFEFVPLGSRVINVVILIHDLYEIVIGDNDYQGVTLKTIRGINGEWVPVTEETKNLLRRNIPGSFRKGSSVEVRVLQESVSEEDYRVTLFIKYLPDKPDNADKQDFTGVYIFKKPPILKPLELSLGFIQASINTNIEAKFISFKVEERKL